MEQPVDGDSASGRPLPGRRATIKDVAARAGVAVATVSQTYSGNRPVSEETRARILAIAAELGYSPDPHARSMRTGRSGMIGFALRPKVEVVHDPDITETFNRLAGSVATQALQGGVGLVFAPTGTLRVGAGADAALPMDGCIVAHPYADDEVVADLRRRHVPTVCIDHDPEHPDDPWVVALDYLAGMREIADRMTATGATRLLLVPGTNDNAWNRSARTVAEQWRGESRVVAVDEASSADGVLHHIGAAIRDWRPDALLFSDSSTAAAVLQVLENAGLRTPDDVQIGCFTDTVHSRHAPTPVTAMDLRHEGLAAAAVRLILARIEGQSPLGPVTLSPTVTFRDTTR